MIITRFHPKDNTQWALKVERKALHSRWTVCLGTEPVATGWEFTFLDAMTAGARILNYALSI